MNRDKITKEQVQSIPELLKTSKAKEIAVSWGVTTAAVSYWIKQLRNSGVEINIKRGRVSKLHE